MEYLDLVGVDGELVSETEFAYRFYDGKITVSLPKSECQWDDPTMTLPQWLAKEKGIVWPRRQPWSGRQRASHELR